LIAHLLGAETVDDALDRREVIRDNGDGKFWSSVRVSRRGRVNGVAVPGHAAESRPEVQLGR
jgi:hypothetical protein